MLSKMRGFLSLMPFFQILKKRFDGAKKVQNLARKVSDDKICVTVDLFDRLKEGRSTI